MKGQLKGGSIKEGASWASRCQDAPACSLKNTPPSGPKKEPNKLNGVPLLPQRGTSQ